jgi:hypothetical protein
VKVEGPVMASCAECWAALAPGGTCDEHPDAGAHVWSAEHAVFVVRHPATNLPFLGRFTYPADTRKVVVWWRRMRRSLVAAGFDPDVPRVQWYIMPEQAPPQWLLDSLLPS